MFFVKSRSKICSFIVYLFYLLVFDEIREYNDNNRLIFEKNSGYNCIIL